jgi:hypothetical protein
MMRRAAPGRYKSGMRRLAPLLSLVAMAACGGGDDSGSARPGQLPDCAKAKEIAAPEQFPKDFPLPAGTVITFGGFEEPGTVFIAAVSPGTFGNVRDFFGTELERRGYRIGRGDSEEGEVEAPFTGNGYRGRWLVRKIRDCDEAASVRIILIQQTS